MIHATSLHGQISPRAQEYLAGWQRARAELANFQRQQHEQAQTAQAAIKRQVVERLLTVADNFQALHRHLPADLQDNAWAQGVLHVARQFDQVLNDLGAHSFGQPGEKFTPDRHEAIEQIKHQNQPSGTVIEVVQPGYQLGDNVVRPAKVKVAH